MPANNSITSDQSITELPPVVVTAPPLTGAGSNPSDFIGPIGAGWTQLVYPADRPKYYLKFDIYNYKRADLLHVGDLGNPLTSIVLPLSSNLVDATQERWQDDFTVGQLTGGAINGLGVPLVDSMLNGMFGDAVNHASNTATNAINNASANGALNAGAAASQKVTRCEQLIVLE